MYQTLKQIQFIRRFSAFVHPDSLSMKRTDLMYELCHAHTALDKNFKQKIDGIQPWVTAFIKSSHILESYIVLQSQQMVSTTMRMYQNVDPNFINDSSDDFEQMKKNLFDMQELIFLKQFSLLLERAGYEEVPASAVKLRLETRQKYGKVALAVSRKKYSFLRMWVKGRKQFFKKNVDRFRGESFCDQNWTGLLHERVVVVSKGSRSKHMYIKAFKDIPLHHFEVVMPDVRLTMPWHSLGLFWLTILSTSMISFFSDGMDVILDFGFDQRSITLLYTLLACYKFLNWNKTEKLNYILARKKLLYYKNTANNGCVVVKIVNDAYERQFKETLLVYGTALRLNATETKITEEEVVRSACDFLSQFHKAKVEEKHINFASAFRLLRCLGVLDRSNRDATLIVLPPEEAVACLNENLLKSAS